MDPADMLQWGRGHVTAESGLRCHRLTVDHMLQWGRGHVTAERRAFRPQRRADPGFNGAAVM